ncbi:MAG: hypothetical protein K0B10_12105 [Vicingaceae bacterium]|nr:hypothetical protein [Vicingaceae bacterium]
MKLAELHTKLLLEEIQTDGHAPLKFICTDDNIYYCKYLPTIKKEEINCLAYEVVAHALLRKLAIPTPDIALITVAEETLNKKLIKKNRRLNVGDVCFGSKQVPFVAEVQSLAQLNNKTEFNKLLNPYDIIKIAIFDLWVNNTDRGRDFGDGYNYNLLLKLVGTKQQIVAFDHGFIFGGVNQIGIFNSKMNALTGNKLYQSAYYKSVIKHINNTDYINIVNNFIPLLFKNYDTLIKNIIEKLGTNWDLSPKLDERIIALLKTNEQIKEIKNIIIQAKK